MKDFSKLTLILFTIICLNIVSCDTTTEEKKSEEKQSTTLQNLINNATDGDTINLEEWENVTDYTATIDKKLTITSGNLNGASLTVKAENVKLEKMQNLSVETSSRLTIKDSKLNNLLLDGNAQSRNATLKINVTVENCEISEKVEINSSAKLNIAGKKTEIAKIVVAVAPEDCKILCTTEIDTTTIKNAVVDKNDKKLENVKVSKAYKIVYHSNCSEIDDIEDFFSPDEGTITLSTDIFKINGHVLAGWYKDKEFTESFGYSINVSDKTADIHVYAKLGNIIGTYQLIDETAKTEIKDNGSFITTTADNKTMNGTWEKAETGYTFTFGGDYNGMTGTTTIVEYDVVEMVCTDMGIDSYAVKKSNENVDLSGTWTDGIYTIVITSDNTFNIETEEGTLSGTVEQTGNCFTLTLTDSNIDFSTGAVSASGKAYICSTANNSQSIYTKK